MSMRTLVDLKAQLPISLERGLAADAVAQSRRLFGGNVLTPLPRQPLWQKFIEKFDEPIIKILLAAALLSMVVDLFKANRLVGGVSLGVFAALVAVLYAAKKSEWLPSLLFVSAIVMFFVGLASGHVLVEGLAVMVAVILATGVAFASEYKSDREFEVLNARKDSLHVKVLRAGEIHQVPMEEVVAGDVVILEMGDEIPADGRLVKATELYVDQSLMTGESEPVRKAARPPEDNADGPEQPGCLYRGTQVVDGVGQMLVTDVGDATSLGQIARRLSADFGEDEEPAAADTQEKRVHRKLTISKELTPLQQKLTNLAELISKVGYIAAVLIFIAEIVRGIAVGEIFVPGTKGPFAEDLLRVFSELLGYFVTMVIIIVVAVPEGLPMSVTVSLALAMQKMTRANSLVRQLVACETIGSATVICSDKTGTLTQNKMQVAKVSWENQGFDRGSPNFAVPKTVPSEAGTPLDWIARNAAVNSTANLEERQGKTTTIGNSTEGALLQWLREGHIEYGQIRLQTPALYQIHFSSERKRMTTVVRQGSSLVALVKGAPEWVLEQCQHYLDAGGQVRPLTPEMRSAISARLRDAAGQAMRTLAFAYAVLSPETPADPDALHAVRDSLEAGLVYVGFVAIRDPLRDDVKAAVDDCRRAGIEVKMITGDNVETARAIGYEIGLVASRDEPLDVPGAAILTSKRFNQLSDEELKKQLPHLRILARARPLDKFRMVKALQELGEVVAVTGDGTNDAPALKKADVGLAMGIAGTEVSKEASKIVLLDDAFSTIVKAVQWGRSLYENIQRFIQFQLTINVSALTITFLGILFFNVKAPFTVLQLLWINVIMDTFASIALCSEPPRPGVMKLPPKRRDENIVSPAMVRTIMTTAAFFIVVMLGILLAMKGTPNRPGFLAGNGPWSVEVSGNRVALDKNDLEEKGSKWHIKETVDDPLLQGQDAAVTFTVFQVSLFFSIYVFFQVWNQVNCRSLTPETSGFHRILANPAFLAIGAIVAIGQILIVTFGGPVFKVEPLGPLTWLGIIAFTSLVLIFAEIARRIRLRRTDLQSVPQEPDGWEIRPTTSG
jgi:Ca2+-transporting ATPase